MNNFDNYSDLIPFCCEIYSKFAKEHATAFSKMAEIVKIKVEIDHPGLCHGCLSQDRKTTVLPSGELSQLFFYLVPTQIYPGVATTKLCWECTAMLRRLIKYRNQLLHAQNTLMMLYLKNTTITTLSKLTKTLKVDYDQSYEFKSELSKNKNSVQNIDLQQIKTEEITDQSIDELNNQNIEEKIDFKEENDIDNSAFESVTNTTIKKPKSKRIEKKTNEKQKQRKLYDQRKRNFIKHATVKVINTNWVNEKDCSNYFTDEYLDENQIDEHVVKIKNRPGYLNCKECSKKFSVKTDYLRHRNLNHKNQKQDTPNNCLLCKKKLPSLEQLQLHWKLTHSCYSRCNICHMYCTKQAQKTHLNYYHTKLYCCDECGEQLVSPQLFNKHYKKYHATFICDYCSKKFNFKRTLIKHIISTHSNNHKCEICHKQFLKHRYLVVHLTKHPELSQDEDREAAYCVECDRQYPSVQRYRLHLNVSKKHRPLPVKSIPCPECGKIFRRTAYMRNHLYVTHMKEKAKHFCELCGKYFTNNWGLKVHYNNVHLKLPKPKNEICDICGRGFSLKRTLIHHRRTHTGERPHGCQFCSAAFAQKAALQSHQKTQHRDVVDARRAKLEGVHS